MGCAYALLAVLIIDAIYLYSRYILNIDLLTKLEEGIAALPLGKIFTMPSWGSKYTSPGYITTAEQNPRKIAASRL